MPIIVIIAGNHEGCLRCDDRMKAHKTFDAPEQVRPGEFQGTTIQDSQFIATLPALSVVVLELN